MCKTVHNISSTLCGGLALWIVAHKAIFIWLTAGAGHSGGYLK